jgi:hypothetical protein
MSDDVIGPIEVVIFLLIAVVLPVIVMLQDDRNWDRSDDRRNAS